MKWLQQFDLDTEDFVEDSWRLLNCRALAQVFNRVSEKRMDLAALRPVSSDSDWANILLDLRVISSHITPLLKQSDVEVSVDLTALARTKGSRRVLETTQVIFLLLHESTKSKRSNFSSAKS